MSADQLDRIPWQLRAERHAVNNREEGSAMLMANAGTAEIDFNDVSRLAELASLADRVVIIVSRARRGVGAAMSESTFQDATALLDAVVRDVEVPLRIGARLRMSDALRLFVPRRGIQNGVTTRPDEVRADVVSYFEDLRAALRTVRDSRASDADFDRVIEGFDRLGAGSLALLEEHVQRRPRGIPSWT